MTVLFSILLTAWYAVGVFCFSYWWEKTYQVNFWTVLLAIIIGIYGPVSYAIGYHIHKKVL